MCQLCDDVTQDKTDEPTIDFDTLFVSFTTDPFNPVDNPSFEESAAAWSDNPEPEADPDCDCELCELEDEVEELEGVLDVATDTIEHYADIINIQYEALLYIAANPEGGAYIADFLTDIVVPPR